MKGRENQITSSQLMSFVLSIQIGIGILTLPADLAIICGHDGWISVLAYGLLITIIIAIVIGLLDRYENQSIYGINNLLYGKFFGGVFNLFIVLYLWYSTCLYFRALTNILHIHVLRLTPTLVLSIFSIIPIYYLVWYGLKYVARFTFTIYIILTFCCFLFYFVFKDLRITFLMPIGESGIGGIKNSFSACIFGFLGYEVIAVIYPEITNKQKVMKYALGSNVITTISYLILLLITTAFFGEEALKKSMYPIIKLSRSYKAPILERIDLLFISIWLVAMGIAVAGYFCVTYYSINKLLNLQKKARYLTVFSVITILLSMFPKSNSNLLAYNEIMVISGTILSIFLILSYIISFICKKGVKVRE